MSTLVNNPNTTNTADTADTTDAIAIPGGAKKDPRRWSPKEVVDYLNLNKEDYFLDEDDIEVIRKNKVAGRRFLKLTLKDLRESPYNLADGALLRSRSSEMH